MPKPAKPLSLAKALDLMRRGSRLMVMNSPNGRNYYVVPGGMVTAIDANKILERPDCYIFDDGLFPGIPQSFKIGLAK